LPFDGQNSREKEERDWGNDMQERSTQSGLEPVITAIGIANMERATTTT